MTEDHDAALATRGAQRLERADPVHFVDQEYVPWSVTERDARGDPGTHARRCLIFTCPGVARRVWDYPPDWRTLSDSLLVALSWGH
jgi:hypothetical protein